MSDWLGINDVVEVFEEVGVEVVVLARQRVEVNHHVLLHRDVVHHMDEVQQSLHTHTQQNQCSHTSIVLDSALFCLFFYSFKSLFEFQFTMTWFDNRFCYFLVIHVSFIHKLSFIV